METTKKSKIFVTIFVVLVVGLTGFLAYKNFYSPSIKDNSNVKSEQYQQPKTSNTNSVETKKPVENNNAIMPGKTNSNGFSAKGGPASGWKLYKNAEFGFEIQYPESWIVSEENIENVRGENTKAFYFKKPNSDLRFAILPRDGLSYGLSENGTSTPILIGGFSGVQTQYMQKDGRRLWLLSPQYGLHNWLEDIGRIDILSSATDPAGDTITFEKMLSSFKLSY